MTAQHASNRNRRLVGVLLLAQWSALLHAVVHAPALSAGRFHHAAPHVAGAEPAADDPSGQLGNTEYEHQEVEGDGRIGTTFKSRGHDGRLELNHRTLLVGTGRRRPPGACSARRCVSRRWAKRL